MTPVDSLFKEHDPANGVFGDCLRACIASMMDLPAADVPHFYADGDKMRPQHEAWAELRRFLYEHGCAFVELPFDARARGLEPDEFVERIGETYFLDVHWLLLGKSRRGFGHNVVCKGGRIVHDPTYGTPHGIAGPNDDGHYWAGWIVRR
jgi:hypothetical protein